MSKSNTLKVLLLPFPSFDTLDLYAPIEVLGKGAATGGLNIIFEIATVQQPTLSAEKIPVYPTRTITEALRNIDEYEIVIQPGAGIPEIEKYLGDLRTNGLHLELLKCFSELKTPSPRGCQRVLMSICTGALIVGYSGAFSHLTVTTHYEGLDKLIQFCELRGRGTTVVPDIRGSLTNGEFPVDGKVSEIEQRAWDGYKLGQKQNKRWVDAGCNESGVRVISSGGISCGIDASLFLVSELEKWEENGQCRKLGIEQAHLGARIMEYAWRWA
ncbi:ThiJ/PfpI family protein [Penicillium argentinense]|uniref:ThiJ/PfpI family protein n=1 Tax=Penicillium argentinense TaxID=1131581 RepID=A0A9W9G489_9EURO|nr:ThiJ/PfpI family protein [Penicillium argentinense]KAJ5110992.1 ThiJ/PfpI family protein [Penicillium argentinense]